MKKFLKPTLIAFTGFLFGAAVLLFFLRLSPGSARALLGMEEPRQHKPIEAALDLRRGSEEKEAQAQAQAKEPEEEDALAFSPFAQLRKMQEEMEKEMRQGFGASLESEGQEVVAKEDDNSVSYEIKGAIGSSLSTSVKNGYLTISGETRRRNGGFSFQSSFHRMFPLPPNVDSSKMETISEKDKVVLRFPKKAV